MQFESIWSMVFNPSYTSSSLNLPLCKYYNKVFESTLSHRGYFSILKAGWVFKSSILCPNTTFAGHPRWKTNTDTTSPPWLCND